LQITSNDAGLCTFKEEHPEGRELVAIGSDLINLRENPSTANKIRLGVDVALLLVGPEASAVAGILDISGISDKIYEYLGNGVDNSIMGLRNTYNNIQQFANPINWMPNL